MPGTGWLLNCPGHNSISRSNLFVSLQKTDKVQQVSTIAGCGPLSFHDISTGVFWRAQQNEESIFIRFFAWINR